MVSLGLSARGAAAALWLVALSASGRAPAQTPATPAAPASATAVDLTLIFNIRRFERGALMVAIFDSQAAYDGAAPPVRALRLEVGGPTVRTVIAGLPPGRYGIKLFHDLDGSGKLVLNPFGIPTEPVAFSNNARINLRAPNWAEVAFDLPPGGGAQTIDID